MRLEGFKRFCKSPVVLISCYILLGIVAVLAMIVSVDVIVHTPEPQINLMNWHGF